MLHLGSLSGVVHISDSPVGPFTSIENIHSLDSKLDFFSVLNQLKDSAVAERVGSEVSKAIKRVTYTELDALPFAIRSFRDCSLWMAHMSNAARGMMALKFPRTVYPVMRAWEVLRLTFPATKPNKQFTTRPTYYMGDHNSVVGTDTDISPPAGTNAMDFELELGVVITSDLHRPTADEAAAAVGGIVLVNDFSDRATQLGEMRAGLGIPASKNFATSINRTVAADSTLLSLIEAGKVNGTVQVTPASSPEATATYTGSTANMQFTVGEAVACIAAHSALSAGDVIALGTIPGCSLLETDRAWLSPGDVVSMSTEPKLGALVNTVAEPSPVVEWRAPAALSRGMMEPLVLRRHLFMLIVLPVLLNVVVAALIFTRF